MLATIGMKMAAVAELDIVLLIIIVTETIRITTIGNGNTFMTDNLLPHVISNCIVQLIKYQKE